MRMTVDRNEVERLPFLDVEIYKKNDGSHSVYRKKTHTNRYLHANHCQDNHCLGQSLSGQSLPGQSLPGQSLPTPQKSSLIRTLLNRAEPISNADSIDTEKQTVITSLRQNGYKDTQIFKHQTRSPDNNATEKTGFACLPYIGNTTDRIAKILRKNNIRVCFNTVHKVQHHLRNYKDDLPKLQTIGKLHGYYLFERKDVKERGKRSMDDHTELLLAEPKINWAEQQRVLERSKRNVISDNNHAPREKRDMAVSIQDPFFKDQWYLQNIGQSSGPAGLDINVLPAWGRGYSGQGVVVSILDDGIRMLDGVATDTIEGMSLTYRSDYIDIYTCCWGPMDDGKRFGKPGFFASKALKLGAERITTDLSHKCTKTFKGTSSAAPLASGMLALVLEANPDLTWRDVQHIIVETSQKTSPLDEGWKRNGAGKPFNHKFGFGKLDTMRMVEAAMKWKTVPEQRVCQDSKHDTSRNIPSSGSLIISANTSSCAGSTSHVHKLEHVQVVVTLKHRRRGDLSIILISPSGTRSQLLKTRRNDNSSDGLKEWVFMTVHCWGEDPKGLWSLIVSDNDRNTREHHVTKAKQGDLEDVARVVVDDTENHVHWDSRVINEYDKPKHASPGNGTTQDHILKTMEDTTGELVKGNKFIELAKRKKNRKKYAKVLKIGNAHTEHAQKSSKLAKGHNRVKTLKKLNHRKTNKHKNVKHWSKKHHKINHQNHVHHHGKITSASKKDHQLKHKHRRKHNDAGKHSNKPSQSGSATHGGKPLMADGSLEIPSGSPVEAKLALQAFANPLIEKIMGITKSNFLPIKRRHTLVGEVDIKMKVFGNGNHRKQKEQSTDGNSKDDGHQRAKATNVYVRLLNFINASPQNQTSQISREGKAQLTDEEPYIHENSTNTKLTITGNTDNGSHSSGSRFNGSITDNGSHSSGSRLNGSVTDNGSHSSGSRLNGSVTDNGSHSSGSRFSGSVTDRNENLQTTIDTSATNKSNNASSDDTPMIFYDTDTKQYVAVSKVATGNSDGSGKESTVKGSGNGDNEMEGTEESSGTLLNNTLSCGETSDGGKCALSKDGLIIYNYIDEAYLNNHYEDDEEDDENKDNPTSKSQDKARKKTNGPADDLGAVGTNAFTGNEGAESNLTGDERKQINDRDNDVHRGVMKFNTGYFGNGSKVHKIQEKNNADKNQVGPIENAEPVMTKNENTEAKSNLPQNESGESDITGLNESVMYSPINDTYLTDHYEDDFDDKTKVSDQDSEAERQKENGPDDDLGLVQRNSFTGNNGSKIGNQTAGNGNNVAETRVGENYNFGTSVNINLPLSPGNVAAGTGSKATGSGSHDNKDNEDLKQNKLISEVSGSGNGSATEVNEEGTDDDETITDETTTRNEDDITNGGNDDITGETVQSVHQQGSPESLDDSITSGDGKPPYAVSKENAKEVEGSSSGFLNGRDHSLGLGTGYMTGHVNGRDHSLGLALGYMSGFLNRRDYSLGLGTGYMTGHVNGRDHSLGLGTGYMTGFLNGRDHSLGLGTGYMTGFLNGRDHSLGLGLGYMSVFLNGRDHSLGLGTGYLPGFLNGRDHSLGLALGYMSVFLNGRDHSLGLGTGYMPGFLNGRDHSLGLALCYLPGHVNGRDHSLGLALGYMPGFLNGRDHSLGLALGYLPGHVNGRDHSLGLALGYMPGFLK
ncbi:hypothetical protein QZH41_007718 [Actinostola sp. cb2023]|nr:hypothetical protein QZH41_007718 [Actinostola sp. cb2023]